MKFFAQSNGARTCNFKREESHLNHLMMFLASFILNGFTTKLSDTLKRKKGITY